MAVFFIDVQHGSRIERDTEGVELNGIGEARRHCAEGLVDVARHLLATELNETVTAIVRDERGEVLATQTLSIACQLR